MIMWRGWRRGLRVGRSLRGWKLKVRRTGLGYRAMRRN
jgi:hypothetical protein